MARPIQPAQLRERVTIEREGSTPNGRGGRTVAWAPLASTPTVWAHVLPLTGDEAVEGAMVAAMQRWRVTIRLREDVLTADRLAWRGRLLDIRSAVPTDDRRWLVLLCESGLKK